MNPYLLVGAAAALLLFAGRRRGAGGDRLPDEALPSSGTTAGYPGFATDDMSALYPPFRERVDKLFADMRDQGFAVTVRETYRDEARQRYYQSQGWSSVDWGFHMAKTDGRPASLAVDVQSYPYAGYPRGQADTNRAVAFYKALRAAAPKYGLETGGAWKPKAGDFWAPYGLGWDPGHIQYKGLSLTKARAGARPE